MDDEEGNPVADEREGQAQSDRFRSAGSTQHLAFALADASLYEDIVYPCTNEGDSPCPISDMPNVYHIVEENVPEGRTAWEYVVRRITTRQQ